MGGADRILVDGVADQTIRVRVVAPPKTVEVSDRSSQPSAIYVYAPLKDPPPSASAFEASASPLPNPKADAALAHHYETFRECGHAELSFSNLSYEGDRGL